MKRSVLFKLLSPISRFVASQLGAPKGFFGRVIMTRVLNRGNRELITKTLDALELHSGDCVLDIGFGGGAALEQAIDRGVRQLIGVDPSEDAVVSVRHRLNSFVKSGALQLKQGSVEQLPLTDASVDAIISTNTVYFWKELSPAMTEIHRVLRPNGKLALGFSSAEKLKQFDTITRHGFHFHDINHLVEACRAAGFREVKMTFLHEGATEGDCVLLAKV